MSLFDNIKYSGIDLGDYNSIAALPGELLWLYWAEGHGGVPYGSVNLNSLTRWARDSVGSIQAKNAFKKALERYNQ